MKGKPSDLLGLSSIDKKVVSALVSDRLTISEISRKIKVPKTTLTYAVKKLESCGLLTFTKKGERKLWTITDTNILRDQFVALGESFNKGNKNSITTISISEHTHIEMYRGTESLYALWEKFISLPKSERLYAIQPDRSFNDAISHIIKNLSFQDLVEMNEKILSSKIIVEALVHEHSAETIPKTISALGHDPVQFLEGFPSRLADTAQLPRDFLDVNSEMYIHNDTLTILHWGDEVAVSITNKDVARFFKEMFESLKYFCNKYNQNERMARKIVELHAE